MPIHYNNNKIQKEREVDEKNEIRNNYSEKKNAGRSLKSTTINILLTYYHAFLICLMAYFIIKFLIEIII